MTHEFLHLNEEVADAIHTKKPIVALESTIIADQVLKLL